MAAAGFVTEFEGEWKAESAGGCINFPTVGHNPQWLMKLTEKTNITLTLEQLGDAPPLPIGIIVANKNGLPIKKLYEGELVGGSGKYINQTAVTAELELEPSEAGYTVLVSTFHPGSERSFTLKMSADKAVAMETITIVDEFANLPVVADVIHSGWLGQTAGGCSNYDSVGDNPQFFIQALAETKVAITLRQLVPDGGAPHPINIQLVDKKGSLIHKVYQGEVVAAAGPHINKEEVHLEAVLQPCEYPLTILPSTFEPGQEASFEIIIRSDVPVHVSDQPVAEIRSGAEVAEHHATSSSNLLDDDYMRDLAAASDRIHANESDALAQKRAELLARDQKK